MLRQLQNHVHSEPHPQCPGLYMFWPIRCLAQYGVPSEHCFDRSLTSERSPKFATCEGSQSFATSSQVFSTLLVRSVPLGLTDWESPALASQNQYLSCCCCCYLDSLAQLLALLLLLPLPLCLIRSIYPEWQEMNRDETYLEGINK